MLSILTGDETGIEVNSTHQAFALILIARQNSRVSASETLTHSSSEAAARINPDLKFAKLDRLYSYIEELDDVNPNVLNLAEIARAAALSQRARLLFETNDSDNKTESQELINRAVALLEKRVVAHPNTVVPDIVADPDLIWLRQTDEFKNSRVMELIEN